jgi:hypothetical protein
MRPPDMTGKDRGIGGKNALGINLPRTPGLSLMEAHARGFSVCVCTCHVSAHAYALEVEKEPGVRGSFSSITVNRPRFRHLRPAGGYSSSTTSRLWREGGPIGRSPALSQDIRLDLLA